jgi:hypothetical protein
MHLISVVCGDPCHSLLVWGQNCYIPHCTDQAPSPVSWLWPREEYISLFNTVFPYISINIPDPKNYKNCSSWVCKCNPTEAGFYHHCCIFICVRVYKQVHNFHALSCNSGKRLDVSCAEFTKLVRLYDKLGGSFLRYILLERQHFHSQPSSVKELGNFEKFGRSLIFT